ncbi:DNA adenine methylase [Paenibacillus sp. VTT E-133291]|uniref:DNA adenine methylase n=1 Tax=Paenibacillus sp. VTT E-133291 TaxID=1986223 RepID=UPI000BA0F8C7|nr:DNA adenine methylase [Paenibacillus sp. VTT E-133291]OZQ97440.1 site-specific DNA methylase [Paenibacillus sp. VTT E-133291]
MAINYYEVNHPKNCLRWFGGKSILAPHLLPLVPEHHCWVEVFGGGGHMTLSKKRSRVEVFNDIDQDLIHFLLTLRENRGALIEALRSLPTSRFIFEQWQHDELPQDPIERAIRWFYILRNSIIPASGIKSGWRSGKVKNTALDYQSAVSKLESFEERFRTVMIECLDYKDIIRRYDGKETFYYIDPPYFGKEHFYKGKMEQDLENKETQKSQHVVLAEMLNNIQGKCMVSYYGDPTILELYKDWNCVTFESKVGRVAKAEYGQTRRDDVEYVFMNYSPPQKEQIALF